MLARGASRFGLGEGAMWVAASHCAAVQGEVVPCCCTRTCTQMSGLPGPRWQLSTSCCSVAAPGSHPIQKAIRLTLKLFITSLMLSMMLSAQAPKRREKLGVVITCIARSAPRQYVSCTRTQRSHVPDSLASLCHKRRGNSAYI